MKIIEDRTGYHAYHKQVFGVEPDRVPEKIFLAKKETVVGFVAGHKNFSGEFYIEYAGVLPEYQKLGYLRYISSILNHIGGPFITAVDNENKETVKILISLDFRIIGFRTISNRSYIEFAR